MNRTTPKFWALYNDLAEATRESADKQYQLLKANPEHPSLQLKKVSDRLWSVRVDLNYRAVAVEIPDGLLWFWIGPHKEYDRLIAQKRRMKKEG